MFPMVGSVSMILAARQKHGEHAGPKSGCWRSTEIQTLYSKVPRMPQVQRWHHGSVLFLHYVVGEILKTIHYHQDLIYPLVMTNIAMENHHAINR